MPTFNSEIDYLTDLDLRSYIYDYYQMSKETTGPTFLSNGMGAMAIRHLGTGACEFDFQKWYNKLRGESPDANQHMQTDSSRASCHTIRQTYGNTPGDARVAVESHFHGVGVAQGNGTFELHWREMREIWRDSNGSIVLTAESVYDQHGIFRKFVYNSAFNDCLYIENLGRSNWATLYIDTRNRIEGEIGRFPVPLRSLLYEFITEHTIRTRSKLQNLDPAVNFLDPERIHEDIGGTEDPRGGLFKCPPL